MIISNQRKFIHYLDLTNTENMKNSMIIQKTVLYLQPKRGYYEIQI